MTIRSWSRFLALSLATLLLTIAALAQTSTKDVTKYDVSKEIKLKGSVTNVIEGATPTDPVVLTVKTPDRTATVKLAPKDYLKEIDCWVKVGDTVEITGAKVPESADEIIAREVVFGNSTMVLRDPQGVPIWEVWKPNKSGA